MVRRYASLTGAVAVVCALSFAAVPAHSVPLTSLQADSGLTLVKQGGGKGGKGGKHHGGNHNKGGNQPLERQRSRRQEVEQVRQVARRRSLPRRLLA